MKDKRAQSLIIVLWILIVLTLLALSLGHRVSMSLRLSKYQRDKLKAYCLAQTGLNRTITQIQKIGRYEPDKDKMDGLDISIIEEEVKININYAPRLLIETLLQEFGISDFAGLSNDICAWRNDGDPGVIIPVAYYLNSGYSNKGKPLTNIEELTLIKGMDNVNPDTDDELGEFITVWGLGKVNIIKADTKILNILILYCQKELENRKEPERDPGDLLSRIIELRQSGKVFNDFSAIRAELVTGSLNSGQVNILNVLERVADAKSSCFHIVSNGRVNQSNCIISCVIIGTNNNRRLLNLKAVYWHES